MHVRVEGLTKSYPTPSEPLCVLSDLDLDLARGESLAITGPSGSGKSTLLQIIGTLDTPTRGSVLLDGTNPFALSARDLATFRNRHIGFVFQDHYLLPQLTVLENVLVPTFVGDDAGRSINDWARELLERVGLTARSTHRPAELSGGERQRTAIARALIRRPGLLLCDEPTGNLDVDTARKVGDLFLDLHRELKTTLVVVTHSLELARRFGRHAALSSRQLVTAES